MCQSYEEKAKQELQFSDQIICVGISLDFMTGTARTILHPKKKMKRS
ncbi:hypothetical protein ACEQPO_19065 [Bacillus sp. SL00103]